MTVISPLATGNAPELVRGSNLTRIFAFVESHGNLQNVSRLAPLKLMSVGVNVHVVPDGVLGKGIGAHEGSVKTFAATAFTGNTRNISHSNNTAQVFFL